MSQIKGRLGGGTDGRAEDGCWKVGGKQSGQLVGGGHKCSLCHRVQQDDVDVMEPDGGIDFALLARQILPRLDEIPATGAVAAVLSPHGNWELAFIQLKIGQREFQI